MATYTNRALYSGLIQLSTSASILYSSSATTTSSIISSIRIANTTATNRTVAVYLVPSGSATTSSANIIIPFVTVNAYGIMTDQSAFILSPRTMIQAISDQSSSLSVYISGVEIT